MPYAKWSLFVYKELLYSSEPSSEVWFPLESLEVRSSREPPEEPHEGAGSPEVSDEFAASPDELDSSEDESRKGTV